MRTSVAELPLLLVLFNRPAATKLVLDKIRTLENVTLYVSADGPRDGNASDMRRCERVRELITDFQGADTVKFQFHGENLGCKDAVITALDWFFSHEEHGMIIEDDCIPSSDCFSFFSEMLNRYEDDESIFAVCGNNFQNGKKRGDGSYYFSKYAHIWGWATWRRAWQKNDVDMAFWPELRASVQWKKLHPKQREREHWEQLLDRVAAGEIDTWDYQWLASIWAHGGKAIIPNKNLVTNVGFGAEATHTTDVVSPFANLPTQALGEIIHPSSEAVCDAADRYVFSRNYCPDLWQRLQRKWRKLLNHI